MDISNLRSWLAHRWQKPGLLLLFTLLLLLLPTTASTQTQTTGYYWRYSASQRLDHLLPTDVNHDGIDEFLVVAENGEIDLVRSDGVSIWRYTTDEPVLAINTANVNGPDHPQQEIIVGVRNRLLLLSTEGNLLWETTLKVVTPPSSLPFGGSQEAAAAWLEQHHAIPVAVDAIDRDQDGREEILALLRSGQVHLYDTNGRFQWRYPHSAMPGTNTQPQMVIDDLDQDGREEIAFAFFRRFTQMNILDGDGTPRWEQSVGISGRVTALTTIDYPEYPGRSIAVGTDRGDLNLYDANRQRIWLRTLNRPITALSGAQLRTGPVLVVGTAVGTVTSYTAEGRRLWTRQLSENADKAVVTISTLPYVPDEGQPLLSVSLGSRSGSPEQSDILLLSGNGRTLSTMTAVDTPGLTRLTDINHDRHSELLLARFATIELQGTGVGTNEPAREWNRSLDAAPRALLTVDIDQDNQEELLVGAQNGSLHCLHNDGRLCWLTSPGAPITHLAPFYPVTNIPPNIIVVRNRQETTPDGDISYQSWLEVRQPNGEPVRDEPLEPLETEITSLLVDNINERGQPEIIVGTRDGRIIVFSANGTMLWSKHIEPNLALEENQNLTRHTHVFQLLSMKNAYSQQVEIIAVTPETIYKVNQSTAPRSIIHESAGISQIYLLNQPGGELAIRIVLLAKDGIMRGYHWDGIQLSGTAQFRSWPLDLGGAPVASIPANDILTEAFQTKSFQEGMTESFLIATDAGELLRVSIDDNQVSVIWRRSGIEKVADLFWGDLNGDVLPDVAVGTHDERIRLLTNVTQNPQFLDELALSSRVFDIDVLRRGNEQPDLHVATENGEIVLFRAQKNRPPLLINPQADPGPGQYSFSVGVNDPEQDEVAVELLIYDPTDADQRVADPETWTSYGIRSTNRNQRLLWPAIALHDYEQVYYSFRFDDESYTGFIAPPPLPPPTVASPLGEASPLTLGVFTLIGMGTAVLLIRQWRQPSAHARRFYRTLKKQPENTLPLLEEKYIRTSGSQEFLLYLASQARQQGDQLLSSLADGLFLLADRPRAGLPIIIGALDQATAAEPAWRNLARWRDIFNTGQALLEAPSITELSLLRPKLVQLLQKLEEMDEWSPILDALVPILTNLRDSERVEQTEDRLVYLNEAIHQLYELRAAMPEFSTRIEKVVVTAVYKRWFGLVSAEAEELRGRAELTITLKTKRIIPSQDTEVDIEITNNGRAAAENITISLHEDPAYTTNGDPQEITLLPPGRTRQVAFPIVPLVKDRFRIGLTAIYDDRNQLHKQEAFGDMVHLLPPVRDYKPISNPYMPGTPLRRDSSVFYGRERLFQFIAENAGDRTQRNVLILIGQRRTGKTSALLRLQERLPDYLLPVYIDCQSLGVIPGIPAFLHDLAWLISDALADREITLEVPDLYEWEANPTGLFQRHFLPQVQALLSPDVRLLLVFDEFEAFENLVNDDILPQTFFAFMRHLMQHSEELGFVFVGTRRLEEMSADYWSVLFNIALYERIRYLDEPSALKLITEPVAPHLTYDDLAIDKILRATAGHPYFLQLVCYTLVKRANQERTGYVTISDVNAALDEMLSLGEVHFAYLWQRSTYVEQALLTAVSHLMDRGSAFHPEDLMGYLEQYTIQLDPVEVTAALNRLAEREIMREVDRGGTAQFELQIGLVGLWVAKHKSLSKLHATKPDRKERPLAQHA